MTRAPRAVMAIWAVAAVCGVAALDLWALDGEIPAGPATVSPASRPRLWVFVHPDCACSRATLTQLDRALRHMAHVPDVTVWLVRPRGDSELAQQARAIPGVEVRDDVDGAMANAEGAHLSGHAVWIDSDGTVRFRGGLTAERGHAGDSIGSDALIALAERTAPVVARSPVFGCGLGAR